MINRTQIKQLACSASYQKGLNLYQNDKVIQYYVEDDDDDVAYLDAVVEGGNKNKYQINIVYNVKTDCLENFQCECSGFYNYGGLCPHCVAALLEYADHAARQHVIQRDAEDKKHGLAKLQGIKGMKGIKAEKFRTTPAIKELLSRRQAKHILPVTQAESYGKVRLEPLLIIDDENICVEFKIGISRMYVLQDVFVFTNALVNQVEHEYGMKLKFVHSLEMFDEQSKPLVEFLQDSVIQHSNRYIQYSDYLFGSSGRSYKALILNGKDLELFLDAVVGQELKANINDMGEQLWQIRDEPLPRVMKITGKEDGIILEINSFLGFVGNQHYTYFNNNKIYRVAAAKVSPIQDFLAAMAKVKERRVYIQKEDVPSFCRELLPALKPNFDCTYVQFDEHDYSMAPVVFEIYLDAPQSDIITCKPVAVYGDRKYDVYDKAVEIEWRDVVAEMDVGKIISSYCNAYDDAEKMMVAAQEEEKLYELLVHGIPRFQQLGQVFISDALKKINIIRASKISVGVSLSGNLLELSMTAGDMSRAQLMEILSKYNRQKKFYRLRSGDFVHMENESLQALLELKEGLRLTEAQLKKDMVTLPRYLALYLEGELRDGNGLLVTKGREYKDLIKNMKTVEDHDFTVPSSLEHILREYQKRGFLWIKTLKNNGFGGILADDMGLGKTLQVIAFLESEFKEAKPGENRRSLIVSPASLVFNWSSELQRFAPDLQVKMVVGTAAEREVMIRGAGEMDILLTSYDLLKRDIHVYGDVSFFSQIADEAQYIKNHQTQVAKAVKAVQAEFKLALTGTPVENRLSELWSIFDYLMPGFLYSYQRFKDELELPIVQNENHVTMKRLQKMIRPFVLRRLKKDVLADLPDKLEKCVYTRLEGEQQKLYDAHVKRMKMMLEKQSDDEFKTSKIQILSELTKLRQICCNPALIYEKYESKSVKTDMCLNLIQNAVSGGHKILLFSQFTSMLEKLQEQMRKQKISFYTLTGAVSKENRAKLVTQFNQDDTSVFCISLKAGGTGLNLTAADMVIHYDPWWNLAVQNQATDRAHRIGQKNVVTVYKLIAKGTIEENIMKLQEKKRELADQILGGERMDGGSFSKEELLELL